PGPRRARARRESRNLTRRARFGSRNPAGRLRTSRARLRPRFAISTARQPRSQLTRPIPFSEIEACTTGGGPQLLRRGPLARRFGRGITAETVAPGTQTSLPYGRPLPKGGPK